MARVAIDARLLAYQSAGTAAYVRGLLGGLRDHARDEVLVVASRKDSARQQLWPARRDVWTPAHHAWERWALGLELATMPADVLHSPDFIPPGRPGRRWARVITVHDLAFLRWPELLTPDSGRYYGQIRRAVADADQIIAVSEVTRRDLIALVDSAAEAKTTVIAEGVDERFRPLDPNVAAEQVRARFGIDGPFFLFVGTIEPRKNLARLFDAFGRFRATLAPETEGPLPRLVLAGGRGWLDEGIDSAAAPLGDAVRFLGRVSDEELVILYNAALAQVLVSLYEGFGLPVLEAMACGTPVLASTGSALSDVVGDAGLLVPPDDVGAIAAGLGRLWEDAGLRAALRERGRVRAARFTWALAAERTSEVYARAVACAS